VSGVKEGVKSYEMSPWGGSLVPALARSHQGAAVVRSAHHQGAGISSSAMTSMAARVSRRSRLTHVRRRRVGEPTPAIGVSEPSTLDPLYFAARPTVLHGPRRLEQIAQQLWAADYTPLFEREYEENMLAVGGSGYQMAPSTYRARLHGESAERYDQRRRRQQRDEMAIALHANNQQHWSPSMLARSVSYFNLASEVIQKQETKQRRLASRPVTFAFLRTHRDCRCARGQLSVQATHAARVRLYAHACGVCCAL
jgi:hypothetical protein